MNCAIHTRTQRHAHNANLNLVPSVDTKLTPGNDNVQIFLEDPPMRVPLGRSYEPDLQEELSASSSKTSCMGNRPWPLWCVGWLDVTSSIFCLGYWIHLLWTNKFWTDVAPGFWSDFFASMGTTGRLLQGSILLAGLKSVDVTMTLLSCQIWIFGQLCFLLGSSADIVRTGTSLYGRDYWDDHDKTSIVELTIVTSYRLILLTVVKLCANRIAKLADNTNL